MNTTEMKQGSQETKAAWISFLDRCFGYISPQSYGVDFAPLFSSENLKNASLLYKDGKLVSSATVYPLIVQTPSASFKAGIIGGVATEESERGQGYSQSTIEAVEAHAQSLGLEALVLWSDKTDFYSKLGFGTIGKQCLYDLGSFMPTPIKPRGMPRQVSSDVAADPQIRSLYERHRLRILRSSEHWQGITQIKTVNWMQWVSPEGKVLAYLAFNRGKDLPNIIHEWGCAEGEEPALEHLVAYARDSHPGLFWMTSPALSGDDPIYEKLRLETPLYESHLALIKILKPLASSLDRVWFWGLDSM